MRILRAADVPETRSGGMSGFMLESSARLEAMGHSVDHLFAEDLHSQLPGRFRRFSSPLKVVIGASGSGYDVVEMHEPLAGLYCLARSIRPQRYPPSVALAYGLEARAWAARLARASAGGPPVPVKSRVSVPLTLLSQSRYADRRADHVIVPSSADKQYLLRGGRRPEDVTVAPTGVDESNFDLPRHRLDPHRPRLIFVGSWIDRKGTPELVEMWARVSTAVPGADLSLVGTGLDERAVLADFRGVARLPSVVPAAPQAEVQRLLADHDVFVLPSWFEGLPLSMLEAAAAGLACVVTDAGGNPDVFRAPNPESDGGIVVPTRDLGGFSTAVSKLLRDPARIVDLGARARDRARAFSWQRTAALIATAYEAAAVR